MSSMILPKNRGNQSNNNRHPSSRNSSGTENLNLGKTRILSKRLVSGNRIGSNNRVISGGRHVNRSLSTDDADFNDSFEENAIRFHENKHTILSNFEEWIKLSTDNKITSKNSWQFALIDYFHDLNVIKDGENINFQRASATLDGCVKIYSSRVESVANETGKLLSGLAKKKNTHDDVNDDVNEFEEEKEEEEKDDGTTDDSKKKRKINRVVESTLVSFDNIRIKKLEQELSIDPLFKKVLSELDEGGAKSLLLNTLNINKYGRVVFDATANTQKDESDSLSELEEKKNFDIDINSLGSFIFKEDNDLDDLSICPTMGQLNYVLSDVNNAKSVLTEMNNQFNQEGEILDNLKEEKYDDNFGNDFDDIDIENFDNDNNDHDPINNMNESIIQQVFNASIDYTQEVKSEKVLDRDLMAYFDERMKSNWRGPEHWKIKVIKKHKKHAENDSKTNSEQIMGTGLINQKKQKEPTTINFFEEDVDDFEDIIFETPKNIQNLSKPYSDNKSSSKDLPEDIKYNSSRLTNLFTKAQLPIMSFINIKKSKESETKPLTDEAFFADQYNNIEEEQDRLAASFHQAEFEDFNNDFGGDDDYGGVDFNDALEGNCLTNMNNERETQVTENTQLFPGRRARPEYVNFSRTAKRVDVKLLKDNLWRSIKKEHNSSINEQKDNNEKAAEIEDKEEINEAKNVKTFGEVITNIGTLYGPEQKKDLSTSFCFICLLHLANEHSLSITTNDSHDDLKITGF